MKDITALYESCTNVTKRTSSSKQNFWDHFDGAYDQKNIPGATIWHYRETGVITIKSDISKELKEGKYNSLWLTLYPNFRPIQIAKKPTETVLDPQRKYRLIVIGILKNKTETEEQHFEESWVIDFIPEEPKS